MLLTDGKISHFLWLRVYCMYIYIFIIHSSVDGLLRCSHILAIKQCCNEHRGSCTFSLISVFLSSDKHLGRDTVKFHGSSIFNFLRTSILFSTVATSNLHSYQECTGFPLHILSTLIHCLF